MQRLYCGRENIGKRRIYENEKECKTSCNWNMCIGADTDAAGWLFTDEETVRNQAMEDIRLAESDDYEGWKARFAEELQSGLTEDAYTSYLAILEKKGAFKEFGSAAFLGQVVGGKKYGGILIIAKHEKEDIKYNIAYDEDMNLITFTI